MSVVAFDFGNQSSVVATVRKNGIDVILNDEFQWETPAVVCFEEKQRCIGLQGASAARTNPKNSISQIKRFIGRPFSDPELQRDIKQVPFLVTEGPDGFPLIHAQYLGVARTFTPTQVLGMVFADLKGIAERDLNIAVADCCIGIPVYFTDLQRRAVMDAATIAGLPPIRLFHETTATALAYGIDKTDFPENDQLNIAFVDIGHASMQVCIAGFKKGEFKILAQSFDRCLGGRDFDEVLFQHFAAKFKVEHNIDVLQNARACIRLRAACEGMKKVLSTIHNTPDDMDCSIEDKEVKGHITRHEFEQISKPILERVKRAFDKALTEAGLSMENIYAVELVGSGSRVPAIKNTFTVFFGKEPRRTMNSSEYIAKGCALQFAILSSKYKVREFQVKEGSPFPICLTWNASDAKSVGAETQQSTIVFPKGNPIPSVKAVTFYRCGTFTVDVQYADVSELQAPAKISSYTIGPFQSAIGELSKLEVKVRLSIHGIVSVESATLLEEEDIEVPVVKEGSTMETREEACADGKGSENGVPESRKKPVQMATDSKAEAPKKKVKKTNVPVAENIHGALLPGDLQKAIEKEFEMALQDGVNEETEVVKYNLETYLYQTRDKLDEKLEEFVTPTEKEQFLGKLQETRDWLFTDGEHETKGVYVAKLEELKKQGDVIEERYKEFKEGGAVVHQLVHCFISYRKAAMSLTDVSEKQKVLNECGEAEAWLRQKKQQQDALPKYVNPVLLTADVKNKAEAVDRVCRPIMTKANPTFRFN